MRFGYVLHLREVVLQICMDNEQVGPDASIVSWVFIYIHSLCILAVNTPASVHMWAHPYGPSSWKLQ